MNNQFLEKVYDSSMNVKDFIKPATYLVSKHCLIDGVAPVGEELVKEAIFVASSMKMGSEITKNKYIVIGALCGTIITLGVTQIIKRSKKEV